MRLVRTLAGLVMIATSAVFGAEVPVSTPGELAAAVAAASPGDVITLAPGIYDISGNLTCATAGTAASPMTVRANGLSVALLRFDSGGGVAAGRCAATRSPTSARVAATRSATRRS